MQITHSLRRRAQQNPDHIITIRDDRIAGAPSPPIGSLGPAARCARWASQTQTGWACSRTPTVITSICSPCRERAQWST
jgi:hypothetical protein